MTAAALLIGAVAVMYPRRAAISPAAPVRLTAQLGSGAAIRAARGADIAISRDGTQIAVIAFTDRGNQVFVRRLDQPAFVPLDGTIGARMPFFSPDGKSVGYIVEPKVYRVPASGGPPMLVADIGDNPAGVWWSDDDHIVVSVRVHDKDAFGFSIVAANGGTLSRVPKQTEEPRLARQWPQTLPGGRAVIFTALKGPGDPPDVMAQDLAGGTPKVLVKNAFYARYANTGHLLFARGDTLYAARFDPERLAFEGDAVPLINGISVNTGANLMSAQYAVSDTGTVVYTTGGAGAVPVTLLGRDGVRTTLFRGPSWSGIRFSPDGNEIAFGHSEPDKPSDLMIYDRRTARFRALMVDPTKDYAGPVWSPDARRMVFSARRHADFADHWNLYWRNADGSGDVHRLTTSNATQFAGGWHPSGKWIAYHEIKTPDAGDILVLPVDTDTADQPIFGKPQPVLEAAEYTELTPAFSPDGRWIAYSSNQTATGRTEILVKPFRGPGGPWQVSLAGGTDPVWSPATSELLFRAQVGLQIMVAHYSTVGSSPYFDRPQPWAGAVLASGQYGRIAVSPDGEHLAGGFTDPIAEQSVMVALHLLNTVRPSPAVR
jgi:serine/threonine-protein kinase